jgi:hypothetical protein
MGGEIMPEEVLGVRDWDALYENNRTRGYKRLAWVPIPNRMDGDGYTELVDHENGAAHLGAWIAIVQVASRCEPRGVLMRDGGRPHDAASLARISRLPVEVFREVLPRLLNIGWLAVLGQNAAEIRQDAAQRVVRADSGTQDTAGGSEADGDQKPATAETGFPAGTINGSVLPNLQDAAESRQFKYAERNGKERNRTIESSEVDESNMLLTPERVTEAQKAIGAHRLRGDVPDETITRKILLSFEDMQGFNAWIADIGESLKPSDITGDGYGLYLSDARQWIQNGGKRRQRSKRKAPAVPQYRKWTPPVPEPSVQSTMDPETARRIREARGKTTDNALTGGVNGNATQDGEDNERERARGPHGPRAYLHRPGGDRLQGDGGRASGKRSQRPFLLMLRGRLYVKGRRLGRGGTAAARRRGPGWVTQAELEAKHFTAAGLPMWGAAVKLDC